MRRRGIGQRRPAPRLTPKIVTGIYESNFGIFTPNRIDFTFIKGKILRKHPFSLSTLYLHVGGERRVTTMILDIKRERKVL